MAIASLRFAIKAFEKHDFKLLMKKKDNITQNAKQLLNDIGLIDSWVLQRGQHSSIFILKGEKGVHKKLIKNNIKCVPRGKGVRISFHYYNTDKDLNHLLEILKKD